MNKEIKLHLGCGKRYLSGYVHIDINNLPHIDYCTEIHKLSMFEDNSVSEIYNCGVIGYYDREEVNVLLKEWKRVLKKDGILRISVVDFEKQVQLYYSGGKNLEDTGVLGPLFGKWPFVDKFFNKDVVYKKTAYDFNSLKRVLESHGFGDYKRYEWQNFFPENYDDYSAAYVPHGDRNGVHIMLNVECKKC